MQRKWGNLGGLQCAELMPFPRLQTRDGERRCSRVEQSREVEAVFVAREGEASAREGERRVAARGDDALERETRVAARGDNTS